MKRTDVNQRRITEASNHYDAIVFSPADGMVPLKITLVGHAVTEPLLTPSSRSADATLKRHNAKTCCRSEAQQTVFVNVVGTGLCADIQCTAKRRLQASLTELATPARHFDR